MKLSPASAEATERKPVKSGLDFVRDKHNRPLIRTRQGTQRLAEMRMPADLKRCGFQAAVIDCGAHYRYEYAKQKD